jgi:coatomer subunit beta
LNLHQFSHLIYHIMATAASAWTFVAEPSEGVEYPPASDLRAALQKGSDDTRLEILRRIITATLNGNPYVR